jgi:hypothetical protein
MALYELGAGRIIQTTIPKAGKAKVRGLKSDANWRQTPDDPYREAP